MDNQQSDLKVIEDVRRKFKYVIRAKGETLDAMNDMHMSAVDQAVFVKAALDEIARLNAALNDRTSGAPAITDRDSVTVATLPELKWRAVNRGESLTIHIRTGSLTAVVHGHRRAQLWQATGGENILREGVEMRQTAEFDPTLFPGLNG